MLISGFFAKKHAYLSPHGSETLSKRSAVQNHVWGKSISLIGANLTKFQKSHILKIFHECHSLIAANNLLRAQQDLLRAQQDLLGAQQDLLGAQQDLLGAPQDLLGAPQDLLGAQQEQTNKKPAGWPAGGCQFCRCRL